MSRSAGDNFGKFCDSAIHLRFCAALMPLQDDMSGLRAVLCEDVKSGQSGLSLAIAAAGLDAAPLAAAATGAWACAVRTSVGAANSKSTAASRGASMRPASLVFEHLADGIRKAKSIAPGHGRFL